MCAPTVRLVGWWGTSTTGSKRGCVHTVAGAKNLSRREDQEAVHDMVVGVSVVIDVNHVEVGLESGPNI